MATVKYKQLSALPGYMLEKLFSRVPSHKHCVTRKISIVDKILRRNLLLSDKIVKRHFCDCEDECLRDR